MDRLRQRMIQTITLILFPLLTALAIVAPKFVPWFYGPAWNASIVPVQILAIGGAAMLVARRSSSRCSRTGRPRAVMWWGWGHFLVYGVAVFAVARLGLPAIAIAAVVVHTTFLIIAYLQLHHGSLRRAFKALAKDVLPAAACSRRLVAVALPVSVLASTLGIPIGPLSSDYRSCRRHGLFPQPAPLVSDRTGSARSPRGARAARSRPSFVRSVHPPAGASIGGLATRPGGVRPTRSGHGFAVAAVSSWMLPLWLNPEPPDADTS